MEKDIETWNEKGVVMKLSDEERCCISNLRFADDVLMMETSLMKEVNRMSADFKSSEAQGLEIHPGKTTVLSNQKTNILKEIEIDGMQVEMLPPEGKVKYLGPVLTFMDQEITEVHMINCA